MTNRVWVEVTGNSGPSISFAVEHVSAVLENGSGSTIICGGQRYELSKISYPAALDMFGFKRPTDV